jgi:regulator of protease activity HflC (stomatin/prohibitin superfamily)
MNADNIIPTAIGWVLAIAIFILVLVIIFRSIRIIPQATAGIVERLGRYHKTLTPGLNLLIPFIDRLRPLLDMREQVVSFPPQPVITEDNLVVSIDTVVYFQVTDARAATYEIANYLGAVEQLTTTTLRNVVGGLNLEEALTSRDEINGQLRIVLDEATGKWGIRVSRVELKAIDPPVSIQDSMEKQMRAERDRRAVILTAEGSKQSQILEAEGRRQAEILKAEGDKQAQVLRAEGEAKAIETVFNAIHVGNPDDKLLAYQYLQTLPKISESSSSKLWIIPSEFTSALKGLSGAFIGRGSDSTPPAPLSPVDDVPPVTFAPTAPLPDTPLVPEGAATGGMTSEPATTAAPDTVAPAEPASADSDSSAPATDGTSTNGSDGPTITPPTP